MRVLNNSSAKLGMVAVIALGGLSLSACATNYDEEFAAINSRISAVDAKATDALQRADARNANTRLDALTSRVDVIEQQGVMRAPRN